MTFDDVKNNKYTILTVGISMIIFAYGNIYYPPYHNFLRSFLLSFLPALIVVIGVFADNKNTKTG